MNFNDTHTSETTATDEPKPPRPLRWSKMQLAQLHELASQGLRVGVIALRLGRSYDSIIHKARKEGIEFACFRRRRIDAGEPAVKARLGQS